MAVHTGSGEDRTHALENAVRCLVGRIAVEEGGFAMHAAGVLKDGRAWLFAGKSGSGKTTAVGLSGPCISLGDDFALVIPSGEGWSTAAVPFDNSGRAPADPPAGLYLLAGVWRLYQSPETGVEKLSRLATEASVMACVSYPGTVSDMLERLVDNVRRFGSRVRFEHLHFRPDPGFWEAIREAE
jgi:hypothetical protein